MILIVHRLIAIGDLQMGVVIVGSDQKWFWKFWIA
jgi:hypothetical protein